jgi:hypothetical protein
MERVLPLALMIKPSVYGVRTMERLLLTRSRDAMAH